MRPTGTTRTYAWTSRPTYLSTQSVFSAREQPMSDSRHCGPVLLLNFDQDHREALLFTLQQCRYQVIAPVFEGSLLRNVDDDQLRSADFVIVDVTRIDHRNWIELRRVCRTRGNDGLPLMVACWSRHDHGPTFQLMVEKLGARYTYAHQ